VILDVWSIAEHPTWNLPERTWLRWFKLTGYVSDGAPQPTETLTIFRECHQRAEYGMSWTTSGDIAIWFAQRHRHLGDGQLLTATVRPDQVLGIVDDPDGRREGEVIVNPAQLRIDWEEALFF